MIVKSFKIFSVLTAVACAGSAYGQQSVANVSTLEWPPYTAEALPLQGATTQVVRAAFEQVDTEVSVIFRPWKRAIDAAAKGTEDVIAYFPGYHCNHSENFIASEPIGNGPLGFAENVDTPFEWETLSQISNRKFKIGTVLGYANTDKFDSMVAEGQIDAVASKDDLTNLKKLTKQRIDAAVIDKLVLEYMKATEPELKGASDKLRFNARPLEDKTLYLCFRDDETGRAMRDAFNKGLAKIDPDEIVKSYFATAFTQ